LHLPAEQVRVELARTRLAALTRATPSLVRLFVRWKKMQAELAKAAVA